MAKFTKTTKFTKATLKKLLKSGEGYVARVVHDYTDDYAYDAMVNFGKTDWLPVRYIPETGSQVLKRIGIESDFFIFTDEELRGCNVSQSEDGTIFVRWFQFRMIEIKSVPYARCPNLPMFEVTLTDHEEEKVMVSSNIFAGNAREATNWATRQVDCLRYESTRTNVYGETELVDYHFEEGIPVGRVRYKVKVQKITG